MPETTRPQDFDPIFSQGVVIVGGHAVNLWASFYADCGDPVLARFAPFTSKDADIFVKDRDLAIAIATVAGWQFRSNPEPRSPVLGAIVMTQGDAELQVDVLRSVTGVTADDLAETEAITFANGKSYSVPAPDVMLKAKLANLAAHEQPDRRVRGVPAEYWLPPCRLATAVCVLPRALLLCAHSMSDVFTRIKRSAVMSRIRGSGNKDTELRLIALFRAKRITGWRRQHPLVGKPDFVFPRERLVVFVDGCYWHGCPQHATWPRQNAEFWRSKLLKNQQRDRTVNRLLRKAGWRVIRIWEHALTKRNQARTAARLQRVLRQLRLSADAATASVASRTTRSSQ